MRLLSLDLQGEHDVVLARQRTRQLAELLGFDAQEQTRLATAVSELARNAFLRGGGRVEFAVEGRDQPQLFAVRVRDRGAEAGDVGAVVEPGYAPATGLGLGLVAAKRLSDQFRVEASAGAGTTVTFGRTMPRRAPVVTPTLVARITDALTQREPQSPFEEVQAQNQELLRTLDELRTRQAEVDRLNRELEETNRGVLALYAELDEKARDLQRASELKSTFLSNVSHELRTPITSIINITRLVIDLPASALTPENRRQIGFIRSSAHALAELVNDLLDLAKIEAGKVEVRVGAVSVAELFGTLRGMLRPLATSDAVTLVFDEPAFGLTLHTDEGKLSQVLRNLVANALKFTSEGEVRVQATALTDDRVAFTVSDTGVGIDPRHQERIFDEFAQVEGPLQTRTRGTGLGLPLSRQLATLLGGRLVLEHSAPGAGSTFVTTVPLVYRPPVTITLPEPTVSPEALAAGPPLGVASGPPPAAAPPNPTAPLSEGGSGGG